MAIRGHTEEEGNLVQLLKLRIENSNSMHSWVREEKYMSHDIINELINIMGQDVLRRIFDSEKSPVPS